TENARHMSGIGLIAISRRDRQKSKFSQIRTLPNDWSVTVSKSQAYREGYTSGPCRWLFSAARTQIGFVGDTPLIRLRRLSELSVITCNFTAMPERAAIGSGKRPTCLRTRLGTGRLPKVQRRMAE